MPSRLLVFTILFFVVSVFAGKDDSLGIVRDSPDGDNAKGKKPARYSSILEFPEGTDVWDTVLGQDPKKLSEIARNAHYQMNKVWVDEKLKYDNRPKVMTALAVGNQIYLSSSLAGTQAFIYKYPDSNNP
jgi:hypothetical protein